MSDILSTAKEQQVQLHELMRFPCRAVHGEISNLYEKEINQSTHTEVTQGPMATPKPAPGCRFPSSFCKQEANSQKVIQGQYTSDCYGYLLHKNKAQKGKILKILYDFLMQCHILDVLGNNRKYSLTRFQTERREYSQQNP